MSQRAARFPVPGPCCHGADVLLVLSPSGGPVVVLVQLEREEEVTGPVIAPLFPQVCPASCLF